MEKTLGHLTSRRYTIDEIFTKYFSRCRAVADERRTQRIDRAERDLRSFLEHKADHVLLDEELAILRAERQFDPNGAFCRHAQGADLVFALWFYVTGSERLPIDPADRRERLDHIDGLVAEVISMRIICERNWWQQLFALRGVVGDQRRGLPIGH